MSWNVENLFDAKHDPGKKDRTFLPLSKKDESVVAECKAIPVKYWRERCLKWNWTPELVSKRIRNTARVILQVNNGLGPDVVVLQEVENIGVLERVRQELNQIAPKANYKNATLFEGPDVRGIDIGIISRLKILGKPRLLDIPKQRLKTKFQKRDRRGFLRVSFDIGSGGPLTVFGVHLKSPRHPIEIREDSLRYLNQLAKRLSGVIVAAGDFNIAADRANEVQAFKRFESAGNWEVSHHVGCKKCKGTIYYPPKKVWSFFDVITLKGSSGWKIDPKTVHVPTKVKEQTNAEGFPAEFHAPSGLGISDHWPMALDIVRQKRKGT